MDYDRWAKHFETEPRSTETVAVPLDVLDFLIEAYEAYSGMTDTTDMADIVASQLLSLDLLNEIKERHEQP